MAIAWRQICWGIRQEEIGKSVNAANVWLLNDLEATAWGLLGLPGADFVGLNPNVVPVRSGNIAVLVAGTGLGEAHYDLGWCESPYHRHRRRPR